MFDKGKREGGKKEKKKKKKGDKKGLQREDQGKVTLVYFLEGILFSADANKNISNLYMSMVDDLAKFNAYHWGNEIFDMMFDSLSKNKPCCQVQGKAHEAQEK